jgi:hypothetical protein
MYEVPEPPKKEIPYPWIVAGLSALSLSLLLVTLNIWSTPAKNSESPVGSHTSGSHERLLQEKVEALNTELASVRAKQVASASKVAQIEAESRANAQRLVEAEGRVSELMAELGRMRKEEVTPQKIKETMSNAVATSRKPLLLAEALKAWDEGNLYAAKAKFEAILAIDPKDLGAAEGLGMVIYAINDASVARKASERAAGGR